MIDLGDPNEYGESVRIVNKAGVESVIATPYAYTKGNNRGLGVLDAIYAYRIGRAPRTNGALCRHVLEAALGICASSENGVTYRMTTTADRPAPLPVGYTEYPELAEGELTRLRAELVCERALSSFADQIHLGDYLLLGNCKMSSVTVIALIWRI